MGMRIILKGEIWEEELLLYNDDKILYSSDVEEFVNLESENIELNFTYGDKQKHPVVGRVVDTDVVWIPKEPDCYRVSYKYAGIVFSLITFNELWEKLRYDIKESTIALKPLNYEELKLTWLISSNYKSLPFENREISQVIHDDILAISDDKVLLTLKSLLENKWSETYVNLKLCNAPNQWEDVIVYLDRDSIEWCAIKKSENNYYIHIGNDYCFLINLI